MYNCMQIIFKYSTNNLIYNKICMYTIRHEWSIKGDTYYLRDPLTSIVQSEVIIPFHYTLKEWHNTIKGINKLQLVMRIKVNVYYWIALVSGVFTVCILWRMNSPIFISELKIAFSSKGNVILSYTGKYSLKIHN